MTTRNMKIYSLDRRSMISEKDSNLFKGMKNTKTCKNNIDKYKENKGFPLESMLQTNNDLKQKIHCELMCACLLFYLEGK